MEFAEGYGCAVSQACRVAGGALAFLDRAWLGLRRSQRAARWLPVLQEVARDVARGADLGERQCQATIREHGNLSGLLGVYT